MAYPYTAARLSSRERVIGGKFLALLLALAASLCLLLALAPTSALAATGSISGTVTDAKTAGPIEGVEVCAWTLVGEEEFFCTSTDSEGNYEFEELEAGEYGVEFLGTLVGYSNQVYDHEENWWEADPVTVGTGATTGIDAELTATPGIAGTVTRSSDGEPVEFVLVCAWRVGTEEFGGCAFTGPEGNYRISELEAGEYVEPGEYHVEFWPGFGEENLAYQFWDHRSRWVEADAVTVEAEETTSGIDAELLPGATISGTVSSAATGAGLEEIPVCSIDSASGELGVCSWTEPGGHYELPFLPGNETKVIFSIDFEEWFGEEEGLEEDDGYPTQFWNNQTTLAAANVIPLSTGQSVGGIDAHLGPPPPSPVVTPPPSTPPVVRHRKRKHCRKGYVKKKVKGKMRCVKRHKHRHHHHRAVRPFGYQSPLFSGSGTQRPSFRVVR